MTATEPATVDRPQALLSVGDVAATLNCSVRHVHRLSDAGRMPRPVKLGSLIRWRREEIDAWLAAGCPTTTTRGGRHERS